MGKVSPSNTTGRVALRATMRRGRMASMFASCTARPMVLKRQAGGLAAPVGSRGPESLPATGSTEISLVGHAQRQVGGPASCPHASPVAPQSSPFTSTRQPEAASAVQVKIASPPQTWAPAVVHPPPTAGEAATAGQAQVSRLGPLQTLGARQLQGGASGGRSTGAGASLPTSPPPSPPPTSAAVSGALSPEPPPA